MGCQWTVAPVSTPHPRRFGNLAYPRQTYLFSIWQQQLEPYLFVCWFAIIPTPQKWLSRNTLSNSRMQLLDSRISESPQSKNMTTANKSCFVRWFKLFVEHASNGAWAVPYMTLLDNNIYGASRMLHVDPVHTIDLFMSGLIYSALILDKTFPKVYGTQCLPRMSSDTGNHALYTLFWLHHTLLNSVCFYCPCKHLTALDWAILFKHVLSSWLQGLGMSRDTHLHLVWALDHEVRSLLCNWSPDFFQMIQRDIRMGPAGAMPFMLPLPQVATTLGKNDAKVGLNPLAANTNHGTWTWYSTIKHIETPLTPEHTHTWSY